VRTIPLDRIVGTVDRSRDFDRDFLPRRPGMGERWKRVERSFPAGDFPPIQVYEVDGSYFLIDGHHRVAIARQRGMATIDAEITRLRTRYPLPPDADIGRIIHTEQERLFMEESGLDRARPEIHIEFSRPQGYVELLEQVKVHGFNLMEERDEVLPVEEVARDWYDRVYLPGVEAVQRSGLHDVVPNTTDGDLFLMVQQHRLALFPERGNLTFDEAARAVAEAQRARAAPKGRRTIRRIAGRIK
jgi:hypothetical protein